MQFTGSELILKRNFYTQTGNFCFSLLCSVDNTTGRYSFGVSGNNGTINFVLESGKIYHNNLFLHNYRSFEEFFIQAEFSNQSLNFEKNNIPLLYNYPKNTGNFDYFYFSRESAGLGAEFSLSVSGDNFPLYSITQKGYLVSSGQEGVTGWFINNSQFPIKVFDSKIQASQNYSFGKLSSNINPFESGTFSYSGNFDNIDLSQPILTTFNTSFNNSSILFYITDARTYDKFVLLTAPVSFTFNDDEIMTREVIYSNYSGGFISNSFDTNLTLLIKHVSGSGFYSDNNFATNVPFNGTAYGNFLESGIVTGLISYPTGNNTITGIYNIQLNQFAWATGRATGFFSGIGTGLGSGLGYTGRAYSSFTGLATGYILNGSGTILTNDVFVGLPVGNAYSLDYPSYNNATGFINISGMSIGDAFFIGSLINPIVKGLQFFNETGLIYYLSGNSIHQVNGIYNGSIILLNSLFSGTIGNGTQIVPYNCSVGDGFYAYSPFLTGGTNNGSTGELIVALNSYTGSVSTTLTGSGFYQIQISGYANGTFDYYRSFTGAWDLLTGLTLNSLVSLKRPGNFNDNTISGSGVFPPNSQFITQIIHYSDEINVDGINFIITGQELLNPINEIIYV